MQIQEKSDLLNALVNLNDKSPLQCDPSESTKCVGQIKYKSLELLEYLSEIEVGMRFIKNVAKGRVDKKILEQFERIDSAISTMTDKLLESRPSE